MCELVGIQYNINRPCPEAETVNMIQIMTYIRYWFHRTVNKHTHMFLAFVHSNEKVVFFPLQICACVFFSWFYITQNDSFSTFHKYFGTSLNIWLRPNHQWNSLGPFNNANPNRTVKQYSANKKVTKNTRMHSSRMRTARSLTVSHRILCTPPPATTHAPWLPRIPPSNHASPPTMHAPHNHTHPPGNHAHPWQPRIPPPPSSHAHPPATMHAPHNHAHPLVTWQPHMPPTPRQPRMPPTTMHTPSDHTPSLATTHAPLPRQPRMPPPPVNRITDACKNITLPQFRCGW